MLGLFCLCCGIRLWERRKRRAVAAGEESTTEPKSRSGSGFTLFPKRNRRRTRFTMLTPPVGDELDEDWLVVGSPTSPPPTEPGKGGSEADPFLTRLPNPHPGGSSGSPPANSEVAQANSNSASSRGTGSTSASSGTNASGYGVLLAHPSLALPPHPEGGSPFEEPHAYRNLPPGAAPGANNSGYYGGAPVPGRRILSPSQMAVLIEEEGSVLPRTSEDDSYKSHLSGEGEVGEVVVARRVAVDPSLAVPEAPKEKRRSWIPRFSWLNNSARNSRDIEEEGGLLLFDAGGHSPTGSISSPVFPPRLVPPSSAATTSANVIPTPPMTPASPLGTDGEMREFGARPLLPFLARSSSRIVNSRPVSGAAGVRPISGASGMSSEGTSGSGKSGGTVFTDARETLTLSTQGSRAGNGNEGGLAGSAVAGQHDPLDAPAPPALAAFATSSQHSLHHPSLQSLHHTVSSELQPSGASLSQSTSNAGLGTTLAGSTSPSNTTLGTIGSPGMGNTPLKPERAYAHGPPGLGFPYPAAPSGLNWDAAGLELGFSRPASSSKLGTFGSANVVPVPPFGGAPGIRVVGASVPSMPVPIGGARATSPFFDVWSGAPHLSLDLDDAPPGAEGGWRLLGRSASQELGVGVGDGGVSVGESGPGRRGTFGGLSAQYHHTQGPSSEQGSLHSRLTSSHNSSSISSGHSRLHSQNPSSSASHSLYPSSGSGASARARALVHAGSVEGPMSPAVSAFGHRAHDGDHSGSSGSGGHGGRQEHSSGSGRPSPLSRARSPASPLLSPWAGGLDADWRPT